MAFGVSGPVLTLAVLLVLGRGVDNGASFRGMTEVSVDIVDMNHQSRTRDRRRRPHVVSGRDRVEPDAGVAAAHLGVDDLSVAVALDAARLEADTSTRKSWVAAMSLQTRIGITREIDVITIPSRTGRP